jgi:hypothetical protein
LDQKEEDNMIMYYFLVHFYSGRIPVLHQQS